SRSFFFQAEDGIRDATVTGVQTCALPISDFLVGRLQAVFLSREDVTGHEERIVELYQRVPFGVLTADRDGALLFVNGERYEVRRSEERRVGKEWRARGVRW